MPILLLPGITYWFLAIPMNLSVGKSLANLGEPIFVGIGYGLIFAVRALIGIQAPHVNHVLAIGAPLLGIILAGVVLFVTPTLPE